MRVLALLLLAAASVAAAAPAPDAKPTAASVKQLFQVMHNSNIVDSYMKQVESTLRSSIQQASAGQPPNAQKQKIMDDLQAKILALVQQQLQWQDVEPILVEVYRDTFSQPEIDAMLSFYKSPAGQAVITKLPTATQESMARLQARVNALTPQIMQLEKDGAARMQQASGDTAPAKPPQ